MDQLVFHFQFDGDAILKDSDEARDQEEYWENKQKGNKSLLDKMNIAIKEEFGKDPRKFRIFSFKLFSWGQWPCSEEVTAQSVQLPGARIADIQLADQGEGH